MRECRRTGKSALWMTLLGLILLLAAASRAGADVVIVRSSDAAPYQQAEATFIQRLQSPQCKVRSVPVKQLADEGIGSAISTTDTVIAIGTPAATWLHNQLPEGILLVYCMVSNPEEAGLLKGSQCWGVAMEVAESDQFKLISEALPSSKTVGTLYRSDTPAGRQVLQNFRDALPHGWQVEAVAVNDYPNVAAAIDALMDKNVDVVWTSAAFKLYDVGAVRELLVASLRNKVPVWGFSPAFVRAGALLGVGVDPESQATQTTDLIVKLKQSRQSVEKSQPPKQYQIAINLVVADQLNIQIAGDLLNKATYIFRAEK
jgi:putative tryptophan/tyrosine transport system substrate-binding protein